MEFSLLVGQGNGCAKKIISTSAQKYKKLRQSSQQNRFRKKSKGYDQFAGKKCALKANAKDCKKNDSKVSARKLKLADRPSAKIRSLTRSSSASRNLFPSKKEEYCQLFNKRKGKDLRKKTASETPDDIKCQSAEKMREIIEIEVFMPYVDIENNTIVYPPGCEKPIMKRYFVNENRSRKSKENMCSNKKNKGNTVKKYLHSEMEKDLDENLNKNTSKTERISDEANIIKSALMEKKSSATDLKLWNSEDLEEEGVDGKIQDLEEESVNAKIQDLEVKAPKEMKIISNSDLECMNVTSGELENSENSNSSILPSKNKKKKYNTKQNSKNIHELIHQSTVKLPMDATSESTNVKNNSACCIANEECTRKNGKASKESNQNIKSSISKKTNLLPSPIYVSTKETKPYKLVNLNELFLRSEKSNSSNHQVSNRIKQNASKRTNPGNSPRRFSGPEKCWRKNAEDKCLSMEAWIERNKYLQARNQSFKKPYDRNPWRCTS